LVEELDHRKVKGGVPPIGATLAEPLFCEQVALELEYDNVKPGVFVTTAVVVAVHPFASVTVQVYVPDARFVAVVPVPPDGLQKYV
jgi:hypothetical protein